MVASAYIPYWAFALLVVLREWRVNKSCNFQSLGGCWSTPVLSKEWWRVHKSVLKFKLFVAASLFVVGQDFSMYVGLRVVVASTYIHPATMQFASRLPLGFWTPPESRTEKRHPPKGREIPRSPESPEIPESGDHSPRDPSCFVPPTCVP